MRMAKWKKRRGQVEGLSDLLAVFFTFLVIVIFLVIFLFIRSSNAHKLESSSEKINFRLSLLTFLSMDADGKSVAERITEWDAGINQKENLEKVVDAYNYLEAFLMRYNNCLFRFSITRNGLLVKEMVNVASQYPLTQPYEVSIPVVSLIGNKIRVHLTVVGIGGKSVKGRGCVQ